MEDEKNLDLSLGLPCGGGSSSKMKGKQGSSSENTLDDGDNRDRKLINEFKNFLEGGIQYLLKAAENGNETNSKTVVEIESSSRSSASGGMWMTNDSRSEVETERLTLGAKRKNLSSENQPKKHERETSHQELPEKTHISITTDEGSTAENDDGADSEVDGLTSRQASQLDDVSKRFIIANGNQSRAQKAMNMTNMQYGVSLMPYSPKPMKDCNLSTISTPSSYPVPGMMHVNSDRSGIQSMLPGSSPLMFGYNPVQLPTLANDNSRATISHHQQIFPTYAGRNPISSGAQDDCRKLTQAMPVTFQKSPESTQPDWRTIEHGKNNGKQRVGEESSSGNAQGNHAIHIGRDGPHQHRSEPLPSEFPAIRPGVAADLKFGGCGSYPNLPWVSTTAPGPNGRTISGVTYRYSPTQIRIVCACHGSHLSPDEFVRHACEEKGTRDSVHGLAAFPSSNSAASARS